MALQISRCGCSVVAVVELMVEMLVAAAVGT